MARHTFGMTLTDWVFEAGAGGEAILAGGVAVTFWSERTGGIQYEDLLDEGGSPATSVTSGDGTTIPTGFIPPFSGPDGITSMWADAGGGSRAIIMANDVGDLFPVVDDIASGLASVVTTVDGLATVATTGQYDDLTGAPVLATVATTGAYADLTGKPPLGLQVVQKLGGTWPVRASTAPDTGRMAMWVGPEPAPPSGGSYALLNDIWMVTP